MAKDCVQWRVDGGSLARPRSREEAVSGAYMLTHPPTGRAYVGSCRDVYARERKHFSSLTLGTHPNPHLQAAFDANPVIEVTVLATESREAAKFYEQSLLDDFYASGLLFNISMSAGSTMEGRHHTEATRRKMSESHKGIIPGEETRLKMRLAKLGKPAGAAQRVSLSLGAASRRKAVSVQGVGYESISEAAQALGLSYECVRQRIHSPDARYASWVLC